MSSGPLRQHFRDSLAVSEDDVVRRHFHVLLHCRHLYLSISFLSPFPLSFCPRSSPYRVGSANFSRRKIGHAHDNSADSENVAGAREPSVHAHFIFRFKNGQGNQSFFSTHDQNTAEMSQTPSSADGRLTRRRHRQGVPARPPTALRKVWFSTA